MSAITSLFFQEASATFTGTKGTLKCNLDSPQYLVKERKKIYIPSGGDGCPGPGSTSAQVSFCDDGKSTSNPRIKSEKNKWLVLDFQTTAGHQCYQLKVTGWPGKIEIQAVDSLGSIRGIPTGENLKLEAYYHRNNVVK